MVVAMIAARKPTTTTPRVPWITWLSTSSPMCVVPSQCSAEGGWNRAVLSTWVGENGARTSAKIAISTKKARIARPAIDLRLRNIANADPSLLRNPRPPDSLVTAAAGTFVAGREPSVLWPAPVPAPVACVSLVLVLISQTPA
jgi:hypothetical protein